jgi:ABC-type molybdate transport system substrate-binding protein
LINQNIFDVAIGYCSGKADSGPTALKRVALPVPAPLADYGLAVSKKAGAAASEFAKFVLSPVAQQVFADYGFIPVVR